jgi:hypothetical protein
MFNGKFVVANWLSERRYFWDFIRPACIGSCRQASMIIMCRFILIYLNFLVVERVEEVSKTRGLKEKVLYILELFESDFFNTLI